MLKTFQTLNMLHVHLLKEIPLFSILSIYPTHLIHLYLIALTTLRMYKLSGSSSWSFLHFAFWSLMNPSIRLGTLLCSTISENITSKLTLCIYICNKFTSRLLLEELLLISSTRIEVNDHFSSSRAFCDEHNNY